jgi:hypothetical protein
VNSAQRGEFKSLLEKLYAGFNMPISETRIEAYWQGLAKMSLGQFSAAVDYALGEQGPERIPASPALWKYAKEARARAPAPYVPTQIEHQEKSLMVVNGLFLRYLMQRRLTENFKGDVDIDGRRKACLDLAAWLSDWTPEEMTQHRKEVERMFGTAMAKIPDRVVTCSG